MRKQSGFTLVELIVVIVILGILAATALPRFIDVSNDARRGVMQGVQASMRGVNTMVYAKAVAQGQNGLAAGTVVVNGANVATVCGYVATAAMTGQINLAPATDFTVVAASGTVQHARAGTPATCQVVYTVQAAANNAACAAITAPTDPVLTSTGC